MANLCLLSLLSAALLLLLESDVRGAETRLLQRDLASIKVKFFTSHFSSSLSHVAYPTLSLLDGNTKPKFWQQIFVPVCFFRGLLHIWRGVALNVSFWDVPMTQAQTALFSFSPGRFGTVWNIISRGSRGGAPRVFAAVFPCSRFIQITLLTN